MRIYAFDKGKSFVEGVFFLCGLPLIPVQKCIRPSVSPFPFYTIQGRPFEEQVEVVQRCSVLYSFLPAEIGAQGKTKFSDAV